MISLIIGSYNPNRQWFNEALDSTKGLFDETIIVDDGSDPPIYEATIQNYKNVGFCETRNIGIRASKGDIIASLDDDDFFDMAGVEMLKKFIKYRDADIWHFPIMQFGNREGQWGNSPDISGLLQRDCIPSGSWFKKSVWEDLGGFQLKSAEDWDFWCRAYTKGYKFEYFPNVVYWHRMREGSLSSKFTGENLDNIRREINMRCR